MSQEELLREAMSQFESFVDKVFSDGTIDELIDRAVDAATYGSSGEKPGFFSGGISGLMKRGTNAAMKGAAKMAAPTSDDFSRRSGHTNIAPCVCTFS